MKKNYIINGSSEIPKHSVVKNLVTKFYKKNLNITVEKYINKRNQIKLN